MRMPYAYGSIRHTCSMRPAGGVAQGTSSIRQHTAVRQHTSAYVRMMQERSSCASLSMKRRSRCLVASFTSFLITSFTRCLITSFPSLSMQGASLLALLAFTASTSFTSCMGKPVDEEAVTVPRYLALLARFTRFFTTGAQRMTRNDEKERCVMNETFAPLPTYRTLNVSRRV